MHAHTHMGTHTCTLFSLSLFLGLLFLCSPTPITCGSLLSDQPDQPFSCFSSEGLLLLRFFFFFFFFSLRQQQRGAIVRTMAGKKKFLSNFFCFSFGAPPNREEVSARRCRRRSSPKLTSTSTSTSTSEPRPHVVGNVSHLELD